jgi:hypothetical protein
MKHVVLGRTRLRDSQHSCGECKGERCCDRDCAVCHGSAACHDRKVCHRRRVRNGRAMRYHRVMGRGDAMRNGHRVCNGRALRRAGHFSATPRMTDTEQ